ncbi:MAG: hypothetical protein ABFC24_06280 [Methanoregulaceae archaeon]
MFITDMNGVPIRTGQCIDCSGTLTWWDGRLRCSAKDANIKQCPPKACNRKHLLDSGQKPQRILVAHGDTDKCFEKKYDENSERCQICQLQSYCSFKTKKEDL